MFGFSLDLLDQLTFYGSYHRDPVNKAIHLVCVPGIAWSALVWFAACGPLVEGAHLARWLAALGAPQMVAESAVPTPAMLITALYAAYYVALEPIAGTTWVAWGRAYVPHRHGIPGVGGAQRVGLRARGACFAGSLRFTRDTSSSNEDAPRSWTLSSSPSSWRPCSCGWR